MKQKIIFAGAIILLALGMAGFGYYKATSGPTGDNENNPKMEITPESFDFGDIQYGQIVKYTFLVKNIGQETLEIKRIGTSCGCTKAEIEKEKIEPGGEAQLLVTYDTGAMSGAHAKGRQERIIYIKNNDPITPQVEAIIYANVLP